MIEKVLERVRKELNRGNARREEWSLMATSLKTSYEMRKEAKGAKWAEESFMAMARGIKERLSETK